MPRSCTVCAHDEAHVINVELVASGGNRRRAAQYGLSEAAVRRHRQEHIPELLAKAKEAVEVADAGDLLSRVEALQSRTLDLLDRVEGEGQDALVLGAIREMRANYELIGRVSKELNSGTTVNLHLSPQWVELRAVIVGSLEGYPEARGSVLRALEGVGNGSP